MIIAGACSANVATVTSISLSCIKGNITWVSSHFRVRVSNVEVDMGYLRPSFFLLLLLGFLCVANSNPISGLFGKSSDDAKAAEEEKDVKEPTVTTTTTAATPTGSTSAPCSGLSGFFHLCDKSDKTEQTEPPKKVKRDADEEDDSDSDEDEKNEATTSGVEVEKRQVGDPEAPVLGEVPPVLEDAMATPETSEGEEEDGSVKKRQAEDEDEEENETEEPEEARRRRRDCRDGYGDYSKDCRRKREYVPSCFGTHCIKKATDAPEEAVTD